VNIKEELPIIVYDDQCYLCVKFAKMIEFLSRDNLTMIEYYSNFWIKIRKMLGESTLEMFRLIDKKQHMVEELHFYRC